MLVEKRQRLAVADLTVFLTTDLGDKDSPCETRIYFKAPERLRLVDHCLTPAKVYVQKEGKQGQGTEKALAIEKGPLKDLLPVLLAPRGGDIDQQAQRIENTLRDLDIDTKIIALGRWQHVVCYIIGARAFETDKPQLWIDKETLLPLRWLRPGEVSGQKKMLETRWSDFGSSVTGDWFPKVIENFVAKERQHRLEVERIEPNKKLPETLFQL